MCLRSRGAGRAMATQARGERDKSDKGGKEAGRRAGIENKKKKKRRIFLYRKNVGLACRFCLATGSYYWSAPNANSLWFSRSAVPAAESPFVRIRVHRRRGRRYSLSTYGRSRSLFRAPRPDFLRSRSSAVSLSDVCSLRCRRAVLLIYLAVFFQRAFVFIFPVGFFFPFRGVRLFPVVCCSTRV